MIAAIGENRHHCTGHTRRFFADRRKLGNEFTSAITVFHVKLVLCSTIHTRVITLNRVLNIYVAYSFCLISAGAALAASARLRSAGEWLEIPLVNTPGLGGTVPSCGLKVTTEILYKLGITVSRQAVFGYFAPVNLLNARKNI